MEYIPFTSFQCCREFVASQLHHQNSLTNQNQMRNIGECEGRKGDHHRNEVQQKTHYIKPKESQEL